MNLLLRFGAVFIIAIKRLWAQRRLSALTALGLTVTVGLALSVPLYADAVYGRTLNRTLFDPKQPDQAYPPFALLFRELPVPLHEARWENVQAVDAYITGRAGAELGLPIKQQVHFFRTELLSLFPGSAGTSYLTIRNVLAVMSIGAANGFEDHVTLREGHLPAPAPQANGNPIEVLISADQATKLGVQVGETYLLYDPGKGVGTTPLQIPLRIAGIWAPKDDQDEYWFYKPWALTDVFMVPEATYTGQIRPLLRNPIGVAAWYLVLDGSRVTSSQASGLIERIKTINAQAAGLLPGLYLVVSPADALARFEKASTLLTVQLMAFSVPIIGLILAFITLVVGLTVNQQRNEIAVLRSRGGTMLQVLGMAALEALVLNAVALALGWPLSQFFAGIIARTQSFLILGPAGDVQIPMTPGTLRFGLAMAAVAFVIQLVPTLGAARHTIITYKQERARALRPPWWQRAWLDVALLLPTGYGIYLLRKQGAIAELPLVAGTQLPSSSTAVQPNDPFQNPLLFLVPALGVFALTLLILRVLPLLMRGVAWVASRTRSVGFLLATRHLARIPGFYTAPLLLLVLTLSLSAFTASLATTLDDHLYDQTYYAVGADLQVNEMGQQPLGADETTGGTGSSSRDVGQRWLLLPVSEHLKVPGVTAAARVGRYTATVAVNGNSVRGTYIGLDRTEFPATAFWRRDFAGRSLGALMNLLAADPSAALAPAKFMQDNGLKIGDTVQVEVSSFGNTTSMEFRIVGDFDLFPTWFPDSGPLLVGNLDYYFDQTGYEMPFGVWLKTGASHDYERMIKDIKGLGLYVVNWQASLRQIAEEQYRPERQGLFGLLSVGFVAAALLTVLGFLLYALFSFRRRTIELGILRATGLSAWQMTSFLAWELIFLIATGLAAGTGLGAWISNLFIPYLQVGSGPDARVPPFLVEIAWPAIFRIYTLFGLLFVVALVVLAVLLLRMKIYQAIKLGETV